MYYLTYNDGPSGVFKGQVADVVQYLNDTFGLRIRLIAFVSLRDFSNSRKKIKSWSPGAIVLPMVPKVQNWKLNIFLLKWFTKSKTSFIFARGPFAAALALDLKKSGRCKHVAFDGRGAFGAEWKEYDMGQDPAMVPVMAELEQQSVTQADFRLAVSEKLVDYWQREYSYSSDAHVVIPCTLNTGFGALPDAEAQLKVRKDLGFDASNVVLVYSGSTAGWQSFSLLETLLSELLEQHEGVRVLFLSRKEANNQRMAERFPGRVAIRWVGAEEVSSYLAACDYGILVREDTVTNQVAAPTKFAEYLHGGLKVLISERIGDYSAFVQEHNAGVVIPLQPLDPVAVSQEEKQRMCTLAGAHFTKDVYKSQYGRLVQALAS